MSNQGWAKLNNAPYTRMKLNLCPGCTFFQHASTREDPRDRAWHLCKAKGTQISVAHTDKGRCADYESSGEMRLTEAEIALEMESVQEHRAFRARNKPWWESIRDTANETKGGA